MSFSKIDFNGEKNIFKRMTLYAKFFIKYIFLYRISPKKINVVKNVDVSSVKVSVIIVTHGIFPLFKRCFEDAYKKVGINNVEFIIYSNGADAILDEYATYLKSLDNVKYIQNEKNIGLNAFHLSAFEASGDYIVCVDHDVIKFSNDWLKKLLHTYMTFEDIGFLAADVVVDRFTDGAKYPMWTYQNVKVSDKSMLFGAVGGWCSITDKKLYDSGMGFPYFEDSVYFLHDKYYIREVFKAKKKIAIDESVKVYHAKGISTKLDDDKFCEDFFNYIDNLTI